MNAGSRAQRVYAGIAVMDEKHGEDWVFKVDPDMLDMSQPCLCVIGQTYGGMQWWNLDDATSYQNPFEAGAKTMGLGVLAQSRCGFYTVEADDPRRVDADYDALTRIWAYAIRRLRVLRGGTS